MAAPTAQTALARQLEDLLLGQVDDLTRRTSASDTDWYANGTWTAPTAVLASSRASLGVAVAAAVASSRTTGARATALRRLAIAGVDATIRKYRLPNGAFSTSIAASSGDVDTVFLSTTIAQAYLALGPGLDAATALRWRDSVTGAADFLVRNGNLHWYTNGNINIGNAAVMAAAYRLSGRAEYAQDTWTALSYAVAPDQSRWPGAGLILTQAPRRGDGADGRGYFAETGAGGTGYDPEYTTVQADFLSKLYLFSGRPEVLRLVNLLVNQMMSRVDVGDWHLDTSGGSRHTGRDWRFFTTPALALMAWRGGRPDLQSRAQAQFTRAVHENYTMPIQYDGPNGWYGLSSQPALELQLLVARLAPGFPAPPATTAGSTALRRVRPVRS
ncbi:hypothetical protein [Motilibacter rhizosphaerae]|uniref:hypothetical protein n=1 Tax=Motilibacter rhizosphaerae TaxID=598652 RepID=UPI0013EEB064|nr:hypothetical protein [Motilibacter rhizosphaerae]